MLFLNSNIFELENFQEIYKREDIDITKFKNIWNNEGLL